MSSLGRQKMTRIINVNPGDWNLVWYKDYQNVFFFYENKTRETVLGSFMWKVCYVCYVGEVGKESWRWLQLPQFSDSGALVLLHILCGNFPLTEFVTLYIMTMIIFSNSTILSPQSWKVFVFGDSQFNDIDYWHYSIGLYTH